MTALAYTADQVRRYDHDRFLTVIFAPATVRDDLFALYAFNIEIAKTSEVVSETLIGLMRLQWWRDTLDRLYGGGGVAHEVARPLGQAIRAHSLPRGAFDRLIAAREFDLARTPPADLEALLIYAEDTSAPLLDLALRITAPAGFDSAQLAESARLLGIAWALTGLLRAIPFHARQGRLYLPQDRLGAVQIPVARLLERDFPPAVGGIVEDIAGHARTLLRRARLGFRAISRHGRSPLLLAALADVYLDDLRRQGWNPFALEQLPGHPLMAGRLALRVLAGRP